MSGTIPPVMMWHVDKDGDAVTVRDRDACTIARVEPRAPGASPSQAQAAALLAAAPDMKVVLDDLEDVIDRQIYDELVRCEFDPPDDREFSVLLTAKQIGAISRALNKAESKS